MEPFTFASSSQLHLPVAIKVWVHVLVDELNNH
jgi:hypothetical protein